MPTHAAAPAPHLLEDFMEEDETAKELNKAPSTLARWRRQRRGPPFILVGRVPYYHRPSTRKWLIDNVR
jgi:hypothetical protein